MSTGCGSKSTLTSISYSEKKPFLFYMDNLKPEGAFVFRKQETIQLEVNGNLNALLTTTSTKHKYEGDFFPL